MTFDAARAWLRSPDMFQRFRVNAAPVSIESLSLPDTEGLLVFERAGQRRALITRQMVYHHVAQGELAGEPFVVTF